MFIQDRYDLTSERIYSDEGFLMVPARISRTGIQEYLAIEMGLTDKDSTDKIRVFRPEEEVFADNSLISFANKPITDNHPPELVNSKNAKQYSVGHSGPEVTKDGMFAKTVLHITDEEAISKIEAGKVELSNGYTADIDWTPGVTPDGEQYDAVQRNIKGNHIAIVERGRAGPACRVADNLPNEGDDVIMAKVTIDGIDFEMNEQAAQAVSKLQATLRDSQKKISDQEEELEKKEDEMEEAAEEAKKTQDSLQAQIDDAKGKIPSAEAMDKMIADRTAFIDTVRKLDSAYNWQGKDEATIRKEIVAAKSPGIQMDSASDEYVKARFDLLVEALDSNPQKDLDDALKHQITKDSEVDSRPPSVIAREKMMQDSQTAWKGGNK